MGNNSNTITRSVDSTDSHLTSISSVGKSDNENIKQETAFMTDQESTCSYDSGLKTNCQEDDFQNIPNYYLPPADSTAAGLQQHPWNNFPQGWLRSEPHNVCYGSPPPLIHQEHTSDMSHTANRFFSNYSSTGASFWASC
jgi:hypothetical protein